MPDLIAIKRLTKSDITFFARHYRAQVAVGDSTAQKSINLNRDVFIDELFPRLASLNGQYRFDMLVYGPGDGARLLTNVLVKKSQKNWRLNGFVRDLENDPERFAKLAPGDLVIMDFVGAEVPQNGRLGFVHSEDPIFEYLDEVLGQRTMAAINRDTLNEILDLTRTTPDHPMRAFAQGVEAAHRRMQSRLHDLEVALDAIRDQEAHSTSPGIGHNQPPEELLTEEENTELRSAIAVLKAQPPGPSDVPVEAAAAVAKIESLRPKIASYLAKKADLFVEEAVKELGKIVANALWVAAGTALIAAGHAAYAWISVVSH